MLYIIHADIIPPSQIINNTMNGASLFIFRETTLRYQQQQSV